MHIRRLWQLLAVIPAAIAMLAPMSSSAALAATPPAPPAGLKYGIYNVTLTGTANGWSFTRTGTLRVMPTKTRVTQNGVNLVDTCLQSGNPAASGGAGAIMYGSNTSACMPATTMLDSAYMSTTTSGGYQWLLVSPDPRLKAYGMSIFSDSNGLFADMLQITTGRMALTTLNNGNSLYGGINVTGVGSIYGWSATYYATFHGTFAHQ
jgi:hypothetical protein